MTLLLLDATDKVTLGSYPDWIIVVISTIGTALSGVTAYIAWTALKGWKLQVRESAEYSCAARLNAAVHELVATMVCLRTNERCPASQPAPDDPHGDIKTIIEADWQQVVAASKKLTLQICEAEFYFGPTVVNDLKPILDLHSQMVRAVKLFQLPADELAGVSSEEAAHHRAIVRSNDPSDGYGNALATALGAISAALRNRTSITIANDKG